MNPKLHSFPVLKAFQGALFSLLIICASGNSEAGEHSWIIPGQCTPPELWTRGIVPTTEPKLELLDKIVFDMKGGRLVLEFKALEKESITIHWMWIAPERITSGATVFPKTGDLFQLTGANEEELKQLKFTCSYDGAEKLLLLRLAVASHRYALVNQQGEQASTGQPATRPESKSQGSDKPQPESEGRSR